MLELPVHWMNTILVGVQIRSQYQSKLQILNNLLSLSTLQESNSQLLS